MNHHLALLLALTCISAMSASFFFVPSSSAADYEYSSNPENSFIAPASPSSSVQEEPNNIRAQNLAISRIDEALTLLSAMINDNSVTDQIFASRCNTDMQSVQASVLEAGQSLQDGKAEDAKRDLSVVVDIFNACLASIDSSSLSSVARIRKTLKQVASCISNAEELMTIGGAANTANTYNKNKNNENASINRTDWDSIPIADDDSELSNHSEKPTFVVEYCSDHVKLASNSAIIRVDRACGAKLRSDKKYARGVFSARIRTPVKGTGIISSFYVSSNDPSSDLISFDFIGKYPNRVLCSYSANGESRGNEQLFVLAYDTSVDFHTYTIKWESNRIEWWVDDVLLRTTWNERNKNYSNASSSIRGGIPKKAGNIFVQAWDASSLGDGKYAGQVNWVSGPFTTYFSDITVSVQRSSASASASTSSDHDVVSSSLIIPVPVRPLAIDSTSCFPSNVDVSANDITLSYHPQQRCGGRFRSVATYTSGTFIARFKCGAGITTSGLSSSFFLSSSLLLQGSALLRDDEIHFQWQANDKSSVRTDYYVNGVGGHEAVVALGFDCADSFHTYTIVYESEEIQWLVDSKVVRVVKKRAGGEETADDGAFPQKPVYVFGSLWNESESTTTTSSESTTISSESLAVDENDVGGMLPYAVYFSDVRIKSP